MNRTTCWNRIATSFANGSVRDEAVYDIPGSQPVTFYGEEALIRDYDAAGCNTDQRWQLSSRNFLITRKPN
ncbi:MAG: hypothetical protein AAGF35_02645 [Pseudomonadota bacterium]